MTSLDIRNNSAVMKRAEQLKRWEESDTNQQPPLPRPERGNRIKFSSGCIFLAACLASDKDEVLNMIDQGADINTANVDGLTALHQACIDDNLEMVEFLVEQGADINRQDNEGWTPLHATASCGFVSIARYLVEHGADVAAVNSDGDLAVDLAVDIQHLPMIDFMQKMVAEQEIDCVKARKAEEQQMLSDAKKWLRSDASEVDRPHPKTGATALHVASAKGYTKVLSLLLAGRANVDAQDNDGWTPLHAATHWGQKEAAEMLLDAMADMDVRNYAGQTCIDVAERKIVKFLEDYRSSNKRIKRRPSSQISRISDTIENHMDKTPTKIIRVEVRPENNKDHVNDDKSSVQKTTSDIPATEDEAPWRRITRARPTNDSPSKNQVPEVNDVNKTTPTTNATNTTETTDVILRRTQSFENDEKKPPSVSSSVTPSTPASVTNSITTSNTTTNTSSPAAVTPIRRSFVPPVRDEESETQRKAHAKRVRETRRSTQGVTLDEIKSAEELVKKKNSTMNNNNNNNNNSSSNEMQVNITNETSMANTATTTTTATMVTSTSTSSATEVKERDLSEKSPTSEPPKAGDGVDGVGDDEDITATFTIISPSNRSRPSSLIVTTMNAKSDEKPQEEVSASFVLTQRRESQTPTPTSRTEIPTENVEKTVVLVPATGKDDPNDEKVTDKDKPIKKTEAPIIEELKTIPALTSTQVPLIIEAPITHRAQSEGVRVAFFSPVSLLAQVTTSASTDTIKLTLSPTPSTTSTAITTTSTSTVTTPTPTPTPTTTPMPTPTPVLESPVRLRDKRPIFDLDTTSPQIVADKLRHEMNRYGYDEKRGGIFTSDGGSVGTIPPYDSSTDRDSSLSPLFGNLGPCGVGSYNCNSRRSLDSSSSLPNSPLHHIRELEREREVGGSESNSLAAAGTATSGAERRPSWRMKFDSGSKQFKLEDANAGNTYPPTNSTIIPSAPAVIAAANSMSQRRINSVNNAMSSSNQSLNSIGRPVSAPPTSNLSNTPNASTTSITSNTNNTTNNTNSSQMNDDKVLENNSTSSSGIGSSYSVRRTSANPETSTSLSSSSSSSANATVSPSSTSLSINDDKDNDKENDNRSALATQAVIQRRRKPKRRSTGVVHIDMDELDPEKQDSANDNDDKERDSGSENRASRSRAGSTVSTVSVATSTSATDDKKTRDQTESSGDNIDYKALWEAVKLENDKLKQQLKKKDEEVFTTRATLERFANAQLDAYKAENLRLKEENGALIRVISKLSK